MTTTSIVPGSVAAIAQQTGMSIAESFLSVDVIIVVDVSGSMCAEDAPGGRSRYEAACDELAALQRNNPGKLAVIGFSDFARMEPSGVPRLQGGGTNMLAALQFVKVADGLGIKIILLSDGYPNDPAATIAEARAFKTRIDTIYIGPETERGGRDFLLQLANATGGQFAATRAPAMLADTVAKLLTANI